MVNVYPFAQVELKGVKCTHSTRVSRIPQDSQGWWPAFSWQIHAGFHPSGLCSCIIEGAGGTARLDSFVSAHSWMDSHAEFFRLSRIVGLVHPGLAQTHPRHLFIILLKTLDLATIEMPLFFKPTPPILTTQDWTLIGLPVPWFPIPHQWTNSTGIRCKCCCAWEYNKLHLTAWVLSERVWTWLVVDEQVSYVTCYNIPLHGCFWIDLIQDLRHF